MSAKYSYSQVIYLYYVLRFESKILLVNTSEYAVCKMTANSSYMQSIIINAVARSQVEK